MTQPHVPQNEPSVETPVGPFALSRNVWVVTLTSFLTDVSSEMIASVLPLYLSNVVGARTAAIGLIEGVAETTASLLKVFSGWFSDRIGRRKGLAVAGYGISTLAKACLLAAATWPTVLICRFGDRVGKGIRTAPRDALIADSTPASRRGLAFGLHRAGDTAGAVVGLLVALGLAWASATGPRVTQAFFSTLTLLCIVPAILAVLVLALFATEPVSRRAAGALPRFRLDPFTPSFRRYLWVVVVFTLGNSSDAFLILRAQSLGLSVIGVMAMMLCFNVVYSLVSGPAGALSDRLGRRRLIVAGWVVYALIYVGFAFATTPAHAWILMVIYGLYYGLTEGSAKAYVADLVDPSQRGTAFGVYHAAVGIAALPASLLAGVVWQGLGSWPGFGPSAPFLLGAGLAMLAIVGLLLLVPPVTAREPH
ncbi:MAG: MFS transporter [Isosphaeraceae bacterium]